MTIAVLDANVLYPAAMRDILLRLAARGLYKPKWSAIIHEEWIRNLVADRPDLSRESLDRVRQVMNKHFPDATVTAFENLIRDLTLQDQHDRHVLAAAIKGKADVIVTQNLKDFPGSYLEQFGLAALHPDAFACTLFDTDPEATLQAVSDHRAALRNPPRSAEAHINELTRIGLVNFAKVINEYSSML
jgi:predicted nucleic acid-binding protein